MINLQISEEIPWELWLLKWVSSSACRMWWVGDVYTNSSPIQWILLWSSSSWLSSSSPSLFLSSLSNTIGFIERTDAKHLAYPLAGSNHRSIYWNGDRMKGSSKGWGSILAPTNAGCLSDLSTQQSSLR